MRWSFTHPTVGGASCSLPSNRNEDRNRVDVDRAGCRRPRRRPPLGAVAGELVRQPARRHPPRGRADLLLLPDHLDDHPVGDPHHRRQSLLPPERLMTVPGGGLTDERTRKAIEASDTDELVRIVDGYSEARDWQALVELRRRCDEAVTRGKQLWGVAEYVRYRLALDAPAEWAGPVVTEGPSRFTLGPLPEVAASTKSWAELEPYLEP